MVVGILKLGQEVPPVPILLDSITVFVRKEGELGDMECKLENVFLLLVPKSFLSYSLICAVTISKTIIRLLSV